MESTGLITIQKYASRNRLSIHTVIKKTMNGELPTIVKEENGQEVTYILLDEPAKISPTPTPATAEADEIDYKQAYEDLHIEYLLLKTKYDKLLRSTNNG